MQIILKIFNENGLFEKYLKFVNRMYTFRHTEVYLRYNKIQNFLN